MALVTYANGDTFNTFQDGSALSSPMYPPHHTMPAKVVVIVVVSMIAVVVVGAQCAPRV